MSKAFDSLQQALILRKLQAYDFDYKAKDQLRSYLQYISNSYKIIWFYQLG